MKRILLGSACLHLKKGQFTEAARLLDTSRRAISVSTALAIDELEGPRLQGGSPLLQLKAGFLKTRGLERSQGLFCKTPAAIIEAITHYYTIASIACPGKHDVCTNPDDRSERARDLTAQWTPQNFGAFWRRHRGQRGVSDTQAISG